jgi:hypothetical protein
MKIIVTRIGILENYLPQTVTIEYEGQLILFDFLKLIDQKYGPGLRNEVIEGKNFKSHVTILLNGRSIRTFPQGLAAGLENGDTVAFCLMMDGG